MNTIYVCNLCGETRHVVRSEGIRDWEYGSPGNFSYHECMQCHAIQIHPFPDLDDLKEAYNVDYHGFALPGDKGVVYQILFNIVEWLLLRELRPFLFEGTRVLDVGCGIGIQLSVLRKLGITSLAGIDFNPHAAKALEAGGIKCFCGTFMDYEAGPSSYDLIFMNNYLEHSLHPLKELKKAHLLLSPGGALVGELPNFDSCDRAFFGSYWGGNHVPRHTYQFTPRNLLPLLKKAGFTDICFRYPLNTSHFALSFQNYWQRRQLNLKNNPSLVHGRAAYYNLLMLALLPVNVLCKLGGKTGFLQFTARAGG